MPPPNRCAALRGDLHSHTWSDGGCSLEEMVATAAALGHEYLAITDHSPGSEVAHGLSAERLARQLELIADLNEGPLPIRILAGIEVDILSAGDLDQSHAMLKQLDVVVASACIPSCGWRRTR